MRRAAVTRTASTVTLSVAAGLSLWAAHPPVRLPVLAWLVAPILVTALRVGAGGHPLDPAAAGPPFLRAAGIGVVSGAVGYGVMLHWIAFAGGTLAWVLLAGIQALWVGLWSGLVASRLGSRLLPLEAGLLWVGIEWFRTRWPLDGFAWGRLAYSQVDVEWFTPLGRVLGASAISLVIVVVGVAALQTLLSLRLDRTAPPRTATGMLVGSVLAVTLVTVGPPPTSGTLDVLAVQGNDIRHWVEPVVDAPLAITRNHRDLTLAAIREGGRPDVTVWPESSIDRDPSRAAGAPLWRLADEAAEAAGTLVAGVSLDGPDPRTQRIVGAVVLDADGERDRYVKRKPVPFGEYVPARALLDWIPALDQIPRDAIRGDEAVSLEVAPGVRAAVAYCFESLFPAVVRSNVMAGPEPAGLVLTLTNDASFRESGQPEQHLAQSRMRAIESGRWVVHVAISGVTAFVDPDGTVHDRTEPFTLATVRRDVPLAAGVTPYLVVGDVVGGAGAVMVAVAALGSLPRRRRPRGPRPRRPAA